MRIYKLIHNTEKFRSIDLEDSDLLDVITDDTFNTENFQKSALNNHIWVAIDKLLPICDFPFISGNTPIISQRAYDVLADVLQQNDVNAIPFSVEGKNYYLLNFRKFYSGLININKSTVQYYSNNDILDIENYVFKPEVFEANSFFMINELKIFVFAKDEIKNLIISNNLTGLSFEECEVS